MITYSSSNGKWVARKKNLKDGGYFAKVDSDKRKGVTCLYDVSKSERLG